jgi:hypothetical protein
MSNEIPQYLVPTLNHIQGLLAENQAVFEDNEFDLGINNEADFSIGRENLFSVEFRALVLQMLVSNHQMEQQTAEAVLDRLIKSMGVSADQGLLIKKGLEGYYQAPAKITNKPRVNNLVLEKGGVAKVGNEDRLNFGILCCTVLLTKFGFTLNEFYLLLEDHASIKLIPGKTVITRKMLASPTFTTHNLVEADISGEHCVITNSNGTLSLKNLCNNTRVSGQTMEEGQEVALNHRDIVQMGYLVYEVINDGENCELVFFNNLRPE